MPKVVHTPKTAAHKKHPMDILYEEKHVHGIVLALAMILLTIRPNSNQMSNAEFYKSHLNWNFHLPACLPICLITFKRLEAKRRNTWSPNFATITNSPVICAFLGSKVCMPSAPCSFFYLQDYGHFLLYVTRPLQCVNFLDQHFP